MSRSSLTQRDTRRPRPERDKIEAVADQDDDSRRAARSTWPVRAYALGAEPGDDLSANTSPEERIAMMWPLAVEAWRLAGRVLPSYDREHIPGRLFRPGEARPDDDGA
jgi:hypothetical protein